MGSSAPRPCAESRIGLILALLVAATALVAGAGIVVDAHEPDEPAAAAVALHRREDHTARVHLHLVRRCARLSPRLSGLPHGATPRVGGSGSTRSRAPGLAELRPRAGHAGRDAPLRDGGAAERRGVGVS